MPFKRGIDESIVCSRLNPKKGPCSPVEQGQISNKPFNVYFGATKDPADERNLVLCPHPSCRERLISQDKSVRAPDRENPAVVGDGARAVIVGRGCPRYATPCGKGLGWQQDEGTASAVKPSQHVATQGTSPRPAHHEPKAPSSQKDPK